jgi:hypothetical protein
MHGDPKECRRHAARCAELAVAPQMLGETCNQVRGSLHPTLQKARRKVEPPRAASAGLNLSNHFRWVPPDRPTGIMFIPGNRARAVRHNPVL